jgi:fatty acid desaturase
MQALKRTEIWQQLSIVDQQKTTWRELMVLALGQWLWIISLSAFAHLANMTLQSHPSFQWLYIAYPLIAITIAGRLHALGVVLHDACHLPTLFSRPKQLALEVLCGFPIATTLRAMRFHHLRHHQWSCTTNDPYFKPKSSKLNWAIWLRARGIFIIPFWIVRSLLGSVVCLRLSNKAFTTYRKYFLQDLGHNASQVSAKTIDEVMACATDEKAQVLFFIAIGLITYQWPQFMLAFYWIPVSLAGVLNAHRVIAEHRHAPRHDETTSSMLGTTVTHLFRNRFHHIFYPLNIGYHEAHHLFPTLKLQTLPKVHALLSNRF